MGDGNSFWDSIVEKWLPGSLQEIVGFLANLGTISGILYPVIRIIFAMLRKQRVEEIPWKDILFPVFILLFVSTLLRYAIKASNHRKYRQLSQEITIGFYMIIVMLSINWKMNIKPML